MMFSLIVNGVLGGIWGTLVAPFALMSGIVAILAFCGCACCRKCRLRECHCWRRFLRASGHDEFDDFELMMVVHEVHFERSTQKISTHVHVTAGAHQVDTESNSNGIFQQPLHITVEQGTVKIDVVLMDSSSGTPLAKLSLDTVQDVLAPQGLARARGTRFGTSQEGEQDRNSLRNASEQVYHMHPKSRSIRNPNIKLTMTISTEQKGDDSADDMMGSMSGVDADVGSLVRLQLEKARQTAQKRHSAHHPKGAPSEVSELEVIVQACSGPLELFQGLGRTREVYVAILGPPVTKRWALGIWNDKSEVEQKQKPFAAIDLMRIQSVQADTDRHHIFEIHYFDESRVFEQVDFRRVDRARDVWVEIIRLLVQKVRFSRKERDKRSRAATK